MLSLITNADILDVIAVFKKNGAVDAVSCAYVKSRFPYNVRSSLFTFKFD